ncbi:MAG: acyl-ACP--UDP-N-acetylglucosamine O-acyltransferase [Proteobacteria bacterium]|nr:acyl-ACP--UDP-N-acetylglucosamine O-acyltransferase [Pseudomonadota bacterium]
MANVHPTATVEAGARLADDVSVGAYAFVGSEVVLAESVVVGPHVVVMGRTSIGARTQVSPFACIGGEPQDKAFAGESTELVIGTDNVLRENVTIHVGTPRGGGCTYLGDDNLIMNGAHIGHDCRVGSHTIIASFSGLAGHVSVEDHAVLGAYTGVHQYTRVGESVMAAANAKISQDAPPFAMIAGDRARLVGINSVGLKRRGVDAETIRALKHAFHLVFHSKLRLEPALARVREELGHVPEVDRLLRFLEKSERGFTR